MKVAKLIVDCASCWMAFDVEKEVDDIFSTIKDLFPDVIENNDTVSIEICEMSEEEFNNLPEFVGW